MVWRYNPHDGATHSGSRTPVIFGWIAGIVGINCFVGIIIGTTMESLQLFSKQAYHKFFDIIENRFWMLFGIGMCVPLAFIVTCSLTFAVSHYISNFISSFTSLSGIVIYVGILVCLEGVACQATMPICIPLLVKVIKKPGMSTCSPHDNPASEEI